MPLNLFSRRPNGRGRRERVPPWGTAQQAETFEPAATIHLEQEPLKRCLQLEQYGILSQHYDDPQYATVVEEVQRVIDERFGLVPDGHVAMPRTVADQPGDPETEVDTEAFLLARHTVTNTQYQHFVDAGGYESLDLWPEDMWPHLIDFKDLTGHHGSRYWRQGRHNKRLAEHPVVGICYYEAAAFVRWAGFRLPTEAEWQMAASWHIRSAAQVLRRFPWGDALDTTRCNIWSSGTGSTAPVGACSSGAAPNGVVQLIGNVWEWTDSDFDVVDDEGRPVLGDMLIKSIRGGAFDTYFASQATSLFRSGAVSLARVHNIGFRCAMNID